MISRIDPVTFGRTLKQKIMRDPNKLVPPDSRSRQKSSGILKMFEENPPILALPRLTGHYTVFTNACD